MIGGVWLIEGGRYALAAGDGGVADVPTGAAVALGSIAHRGELSELFSRARAVPHGYLWIDVENPSQPEMALLGDVFGLPPLQVEDALSARQRPKYERSGSGAFLVMRSLEYVAADREVETHQVAVFAGRGYLLTIAHDRAGLAASTHARLAREPSLLRHGSVAGVYALLDVVVDEYLAVASEIADDIEEVEESVFSPERSDDAGAIYTLKRENLELRRAAGPLSTVARQINRSLVEPIDEHLEPYYEDVSDHLARVVEAADNHDQLLMTMLMASTARQDLRQNADMRRISAWVAIAAVPTLIAGIYGMNFVFMPELDEWWGYPFALGLMGVVCIAFYRIFKRARWL